MAATHGPAPHGRRHPATNPADATSTAAAPSPTGAHIDRVSGGVTGRSANLLDGHREPVLRTGIVHRVVVILGRHSRELLGVVPQRCIWCSACAA